MAATADVGVEVVKISFLHQIMSALPIANISVNPSKVPLFSFEVLV